ncbi:MAG: SusC/RagA family TonB-linked outer membrane protein [Gemmatimonadaceae bacterium]
MRIRTHAQSLLRIGWRLASALAVVAFILSARPLLAQSGTVEGRVTDAGTGLPLAMVQVSVTGTRVGAATGPDGRFRITGVSATARELIARRIGYKPSTASFTPDAQGNATVTIVMTVSATTLEATVVTGAVGDTRKRAIGNSVATVNAPDAVGKIAVANLTELMQAKTPGLTLMPGSGSAGTATNYRLRGAGSLYGNNTPTVYVDGVRVSSRDQGSFNAFGQTVSSLDAINPGDIESIEVIKGPAAATLYGAEAAAGVIQIITKRGRAGTVKWDARYEVGASDWDKNLRPMNYGIATAAKIADPVTWPGFKGKAVGDIISLRPMTDGRALRTGQMSKLAVSASGGTDRSNFFVSLGADKEEGTYFNNFANLNSIRGNFSFAPTNKLSFSTSVGISHNHVRLPLNDNAAQGMIISSYLALPGRAYAYPGAEGYFTITPELANRYDNQTVADRFIVGMSADYNPVPWFHNKIRAGLDVNVGAATLYFAPDARATYAPRFSMDIDNSKGFLAEGRPLSKNLTLNYDATVAYDLSNELKSNSSFGLQYLANQYKRTDAIGTDLGSAGIKSVSSAAVTISSQDFAEQKSFGLYAQEQLAWRDRLFATAAVRMDNNSAFGSDLNRVFYPKLSLSYAISEEPFFRLPYVDELRLRAAWGQAGNSPGPLDALRSYTSSVVTTATGTQSALRYSTVGNPGLKPERGNEIELGFETSSFDGRLGLDITYYTKRTNDALMPVANPLSTGFSGSQLVNLGTISNSGFEVRIDGTPYRSKPVTVEATFTASTNKNRLVSFGDNRPPIIYGQYAQSQRHQVGYPLGGFWAQQVLRNADGTPTLVNGRPVIDPVSVYMGPSAPTREMAFSPNITIFEKIHFNGLLDYKGGHYQFNVKDWRRDRSGVSWATVNPAADPNDVIVRQFASQTYMHIQQADFVKLRSLSLSYDLPTRLLQKYIGVDNATFSVAGHNLKIWTKYGGADPEVNFNGTSTFYHDDSWTVPQTRRFSASFAVRF